ncbi:terpene synthase family protein [Actinomadura miaoliensis]|uniref:Terpene synthase n=1 Tax=Actinomadura miaoliensis TaxID=430685 RepID=A0ABP7WWT9_9ACTN
MDASLLLSLTDRVAVLATPSAMHPDAWPLGERVDGWARGRGLILGDPDGSPLGRGRFERLAARVFPTADLDRVDLFARWLTWAFALDDTLDQEPLAGSATAVHELYEDLLRAMRLGHARPGARPLETTLVELWDVTATRMDREWRRRFMLHMEAHRTGCAQEAVNRRTGRVPAPREYAGLRRRAAAPFLYDLVEPVLGVVLADRLTTSPQWVILSEGVADVVAWSNDIASFTMEDARQDAHNLVAVMCQTHGCRPREGARLVLDRIVERLDEVQEAVRVLPATMDRLELSPEQRQTASQIARVLLGTPRAHVDWLTESGRYNASADAVATASGRRPPGLDTLSHLRP